MASTTHQSLSMGLRGTIIRVYDANSAKKAQEAGACAVVLDYCNETTFRQGMDMIKKIKKSVSIPVIATCRIGHSGEAHILASLCGENDYIQETYALNAPVDVKYGPYIDKHSFNIPFVCCCSNLTNALKRVSEGASLLRIINVERKLTFESMVKDVIQLNKEITNLNNMDERKLKAFAKKISVPYGLVEQTKKLGRLPVPLFASYVNTPEDAVMMMQLGVDGVYICGYSSKKDYFSTMVKAVKHYDDPKIHTML